MAGVCPVCGLLEKNLNTHIRYIRYQGEKQVCSLCSHEFRSLILLNKHNKSVHEKAPCTECGKNDWYKKYEYPYPSGTYSWQSEKIQMWYIDLAKALLIIIAFLIILMFILGKNLINANFVHLAFLIMGTNLSMKKFIWIVFVKIVQIVINILLARIHLVAT